MPTPMTTIERSEGFTFITFANMWHRGFKLEESGQYIYVYDMSGDRPRAIWEDLSSPEPHPQDSLADKLSAVSERRKAWGKVQAWVDNHLNGASDNPIHPNHHGQYEAWMRRNRNSFGQN